MRLDQTFLNIDIKQKSQDRVPGLPWQTRDGHQAVEVKTTAVPLVSDGAVGIAIAEDNFVLCQSRA